MDSVLKQNKPSQNFNALQTSLNIVEAIKKEFDILLKFGAELEFYLRCDEKIDLYKSILIDGDSHKYVPEKGWQQYECVFNSTADIKNLN